MIIANIINKTLAIVVLTVYNAYYSKERNRTMTITVLNVNSKFVARDRTIAHAANGVSKIIRLAHFTKEVI